MLTVDIFNTMVPEGEDFSMGLVIANSETTWKS